MKLFLAVTGCSALVVSGAVGTSIAQDRMQPTQMMSSGRMTMGSTSTQVTAPTTLATSIASPTVKAKKK